MNRPLQIRSLRALVWRYPLKTPVVTSFGAMHDRPMVLVRAEDTDGIAGWGEIWCNFPAVGAEHRARLVHGVLAPIVTSRPFRDVADAFDALTTQTSVLALQAGEPGPFAQAIAGVDIALWDLHARRAGQPLWRLLGGGSPVVSVYASGINPDGAVSFAEARRREGFTAFKLKIGFGHERDVSNVRALRKALGDETPLMVDANQAWTLETALDIVRRLDGLGLRWLEEPLRAARHGASGAHCETRPRFRWRREKTSRAMTLSTQRSRRMRYASSSPTWRNGAASPGTSRWRAACEQRDARYARTTSVAASVCSPPPTGSLRQAAADGSKWTPIPTRCDHRRAGRSGR